MEFIVLNHTEIIKTTKLKLSPIF